MMKRKSKNGESPDAVLILNLRRDIQDALSILAEIKAPSDRVQNAIYILENALAHDETLEELIGSVGKAVRSIKEMKAVRGASKDALELLIAARDAVYADQKRRRRGAMWQGFLVFAFICGGCSFILTSLGARAGRIEATQVALTSLNETATATLWTLTPSYTPTITLTPSETLTPTLTFTPSNTPTITQTPSITPTQTTTSTPSPTAPAPTEIPNVTSYNQVAIRYATGNINIRPCPSVAPECAASGSLSFGEPMNVTGEAIGDTVNGSTLWYRIEKDSRVYFVHSSLTSRTRPAPTAIPRVNTSPSTSSSSGGGGITNTSPAASNPPPSGGGCPNMSATCSQLTCAQAYACLAAGNGRLDRDNDGVPCESVCR